MRSRITLATLVVATIAPIGLAATASADAPVGSHVADGYVGNNVSLLGNPVADEGVLDGGGYMQQFDKGWLFKQDATDPTYAVVGAFHNAIPALDQGDRPYGFPTSNPTAIAGGYAQTFEDADLTSSTLESGTAFILDKNEKQDFENAGGMKGLLGVATGSAPTSWYQSHSMRWFTSGAIDETNHLAVHGGIGSYFRNTSGVSQVVQTPTGTEVASDGGWYQDFTGGRIYYHDASTKAYMKGGILQKFSANGGTAKFGWPTAPEHNDSTYGAVQSTTKGTFYYSTGSLNKPGSNTTPATQTVTRYTTSKVNVRSSASTSASVAGLLEQGTKVTGTISGSWLKVATPSQYAGKYISTTVLSSSAPSKPAPTPTSNAWKPAAQYLQPSKGAYTAVGGYTISSGMNGIKVYLAQKKLGIAYSPMSSTMGPTTTSKLKAFQKAHGLSADGVIGPKTWAALNTGYSFDIDAWKNPSKVATDASRTTRVNAMVAWAKAQLGKPYVWGGTGPMGFDCSGFLLQALRAGGVDPKNVSNYTDVRPASDLSNQMLHDSEFQKGSLSNLQLGDFVYYGTGSTAHHVSMYIGNGQVINAAGSRIYITSVSDTLGWPNMVGVNRAFAL